LAETIPVPLAFGCSEDKLDDLRNDIIKKHGKKFKLIADDKPIKTTQQEPQHMYN